MSRPRDIGEFKPPSVHEARERISSLKRLKLENASVDFLKERITPLFKGYVLNTPILDRGQEVFRGVPWKEKTTNISQLTYPPASSVTKFQRANRPGEPRFYCSIAREAPFFELNVIPGTHIAVSKWRLREKLWVNNVGYTVDTFNRLNSTRASMPWWQSSAGVTERPVTKLIHQFLSEQFTREIPDGSEHLYKISIAIAEKHIMNFIHDSYDESWPLDRRIAGLIYPTVAMRAKSDNVMLLPEFVDLYLELVLAEYIRVDKATSDFKYEITMLDFANSFGSDGAIEWKGRAPHWVLPPGASAQVTVENGKMVARNEKGELLQLI